MEEFNKELEEIKNELNEVKLRDEFKQNLKIKMKEELNKPDIKEKTRTVLFPKKLIATFACVIFLISSLGVFADEIECLVTNIFSNTDKQIEEAIENGNYKEIDMEYVEHDGVGIKVDYIIQDEDKFCIAFNVRCEEEFNKIQFDRLEIFDGNKIKLFDIKNENYKYNKTIKNISKKNIIVLYKFDKKIFDMEIIRINDLFIKNNGVKKTIFNEWEIKI